MTAPLRLVVMSDTHGRETAHPVPDGDILLHAGDMTDMGRSPAAVAAFDAAVGDLPHPHKLAIAGNHDYIFQKNRKIACAVLKRVTYLEDERAEVEGLTIWGTPWQPWFCKMAFNLRGEPALAEKWALFPDRVDILMTHSPPWGIGDLCFNGRRAGSRTLRERVGALRPRLHIFGHIHEDRGWWRVGETLFVNAAQNYDAHPPFVIDWHADGPRVVSGEAGGPIEA